MKLVVEPTGALAFAAALADAAGWTCAAHAWVRDRQRQRRFVALRALSGRLTAYRIL